MVELNTLESFVTLEVKKLEFASKGKVYIQVFANPNERNGLSIWESEFQTLKSFEDVAWNHKYEKETIFLHLIRSGTIELV